jgi:hypothetical protein
MVMRHKPILPKQHQPQKRKIKNPVTVYLNTEQQAALTQFQKDFQKALPLMVETAGVAQRIFQEVMDAPQWKIVETDKPNDVPKPQMWTVGHAKVNHVDHIERGLK